MPPHGWLVASCSPSSESCPCAHYCCCALQRSASELAAILGTGRLQRTPKALLPAAVPAEMAGHAITAELFENQRLQVRGVCSRALGLCAGVARVGASDGRRDQLTKLGWHSCLIPCWAAWGNWSRHGKEGKNEGVARALFLVALTPCIPSPFFHPLQPFRGWGSTWPGHFLPTDKVHRWSLREIPGEPVVAGQAFDDIAPQAPEVRAWASRVV